MDEIEFQRILNLFPIVRPRDFNYADTASSRRSLAQPEHSELQNRQDARDGEDKESSNHKIDQLDAFWAKLQMVTEKKVGATEAERFCKGFRKVYTKLVYEGLSLDAARNLLSRFNSYGEL